MLASLSVSIAPTPPIQPEETLVSSAKVARVDSLVHGLEERDVSDSGRWAKVAPLHTGAYDAQDVVRVVEANKSGSPPLCEEERLLGLQYETHLYTFSLCW